jgi:hypothetical protein
MIKFREFVDEIDKNQDQLEILKRIVTNDGFRPLIKKMIRSTQDSDLLNDLKLLYHAINVNDQYPIRNRKPDELDVVTRPKADGGSVPSGNEGGEE